MAARAYVAKHEGGLRGAGKALRTASQLTTGDKLAALKTNLSKIFDGTPLDSLIDASKKSIITTLASKIATNHKKEYGNFDSNSPIHKLFQQLCASVEFKHLFDPNNSNGLVATVVDGPQGSSVSVMSLAGLSPAADGGRVAVGLSSDYSLPQYAVLLSHASGDYLTPDTNVTRISAVLQHGTSTPVLVSTQSYMASKVLSDPRIFQHVCYVPYNQADNTVTIKAFGSLLKVDADTYTKAMATVGVEKPQEIKSTDGKPIFVKIGDDGKLAFIPVLPDRPLISDDTKTITYLDSTGNIQTVVIGMLDHTSLDLPKGLSVLNDGYGGLQVTNQVSNHENVTRNFIITQMKETEYASLAALLRGDPPPRPPKSPGAP